MGKCPECGEWNRFIEEIIQKETKKPSYTTKTLKRSVPITEVTKNDGTRLKTDIVEFDRVMGGGIVLGSVVLVGGTPGIGKSTLLLQIASRLAEKGKNILYVSGEESLSQIKMRAERLSIRSKNVYLISETNVDAIAAIFREEKPALAIVDSIQTVYSQAMESLPGNVSQVRFCGQTLTSTAKEEQIPLLLVGHVTKEGALAGPKVLEHIVDCLLLFDGDGQHFYRLLRTVKNRFGSTNEVGIFEMTNAGIVEVNNPSEHLISQRQEESSGTVVTVSLEGTRPLLVEVQALVTSTSYGVPQRTATGLPHKRLSILLAVLEKRLGLKFGTQDVFINIAGGLQLTEPGVDLAVMVAMVSSLKEHPIASKVAVIGEVGLTGEVRGISQIEKRISEAERLGFCKLIIPEINLKGIRNKTEVELIGVNTVRETVNHLIE
jgi:DNA repair protein RadA/Sms